MPYVDFAYVAGQIDGESRLRELLEGHADDVAAGTGDPHPYFEEQEAIAEREANIALATAGYETPLPEPLEDTILKKAVAAITVDHISQTDSNREEWVDRFVKWGRAYLKKIADGEVTVVGAVTDDAPTYDAQTEGSFVDAPMFDGINVDAPVNSIFKPLRRPRNPNRWG